MSSILLVGAAIVGLYFPSALGGVIMPQLVLPQWFVLYAVLALLLLSGANRYRLELLIAGAAIHALLLLFTLLSPFWQITWGAWLPYIAVLLLFGTDLRQPFNAALLRRAFLLINVINLCAIYGTLLEIAPVRRLIVDYYSAVRPDMVPRMLALNKPVMSFATHSIAAFFFYLLFFLNLTSFNKTRHRRYLLFAIGYLLALPMLKSVTAYALLPLAIVQLCYQLLAARGLLLLALACPLLIAAGWDALTPLLDAFGRVFSSDSNGFLSRYLSTSGVFHNVYSQLKENPLLAIGISYSDTLYYTDSGPVVLLLRGSFFLLIAFYFGFYRFFRVNVRHVGTAVLLCLVFGLFEVGYPNLLYVRTLCFIPFALAYLNTLDTPQPERTRNSTPRSSAMTGSTFSRV